MVSQAALPTRAVTSGVDRQGVQAGGQCRPEWGTFVLAERLVVTHPRAIAQAR